MYTQEQLNEATKDGASHRTWCMLYDIHDIQESLDEQDAEGHIWWARFQKFVESYEPSIGERSFEKIQAEIAAEYAGSDDLPF